MAARVLLVLTLLAGACTQRNPEFCERDEQCAEDEVCALSAPYQGLTHVCMPVGGVLVDAPLAIDGAGAKDAAVVHDAAPDAAPDAALRCPDAGSCPASAPICRAGICEGCRAGTTECPDLAAPVCTAGGTCAACGDDTQCAARTATPRCLAGTCVECKLQADCRTVDRPVCEVSAGSCRPCAADNECSASGLCDLATGRCVAIGDILRVAENGTGDCVATPCGSIAQALDKTTTARKWLLLAAGTYRESVAIAGKTVVLVGAGSDTTTIDPSGAPNIPAVSVSGGADATLRKLKLANATGDGNANGVMCSGTKLTMLDVRVEDNDAIGVVANPCKIDIRRARIFGNGGGGVRIVASDFTLVNDVIGLNGSGLAPVGGVRILDNPPGAVRFEHNTVAGNASINTAVAGVACEGLTAPLRFSNSIIFGNSGAPSQVGGMCTWTYSAFPEATGPTNITADPLFVSPAQRNFKLMNNSSAINAADPASTVRDDVEGGARPLGGRADMGAYEVR